MAHKVLILAVALMSASAHATSSAPATKKSFSSLEIGVKAYNLMQGTSKMILAMKLGSRADDATYLNTLADKYKGDRLPKATVKNGDVYLQGLEWPIKIANLKEGTFSLRGRIFDINMKEGAEATFDALDAIVNPKPSVGSSGAILVGIFGISAAIYGADQCFSDDGSQVGCGVGGLIGGVGIGYLLGAVTNQPPPTNMVCYPGQQGCAQVVLMGPRGPVNTIAQCPGQPVSYNPVIGQQAGTYAAPRMASSLIEMCSYPTTMNLINTAYSAGVPPVKPAARTPAQTK